MKSASARLSRATTRSGRIINARGRSRAPRLRESGSGVPSEVVPGERVVGIDVGGCCTRHRPRRACQHAEDRLHAHSTAGDSGSSATRAAYSSSAAERRAATGALPPSPGAPAGNPRPRQCQLVLPQRLDGVALLPECESQIEMRERTALTHLGPRHLMRLGGVEPAIAIQRDACARAKVD
jgi:hypothetical protein